MPLSDAMLQNLIGFTTGLAGAAVGGLFTLKAAYAAIREENDKERRSEDTEVHNMLLALRAEISALWDFHMRRIGEGMETLPEGKALEFFYPLTQNYFTVYDSNAGRLGCIRNDELRNAIVVCYNKCKKIVDGFKYNNELFRQYRDLINLHEDSPQVKVSIDARFKDLVAYAAVIKEDHYEVKSYVEQLIALIDKQTKSKVPGPVA